jgi:hypothetical protein
MAHLSRKSFLPFSPFAKANDGPHNITGSMIPQITLNFVDLAGVLADIGYPVSIHVFERDQGTMTVLR